MKLRYLTFALGVHAGAIALAFVHVSVRELHAPGTTTLQSQVSVRKSGLKAVDPPAPALDMPEAEVEARKDAVAPRDLVLPRPKREPEPLPPDMPAEWPDAEAPERRLSPAPLVRLDKPTVKPTPEEPAPETIEAPTNDESEAEKPLRSANVPGAENPPRLLAPEWPDEIRNNFTGRVLVAVVVSPAGQAISVEIVEGTGIKRWDALLKDTFRFTPYAPGRTNGMPVICSHRFRVSFRRH